MSCSCGEKKWQMNGSVSLLVAFTFCFKQFCILSNAWVLSLLEWFKGKIINVNHWQVLLTTKLMSCPKEHRTSVKKFTTVLMFLYDAKLYGCACCNSNGKGKFSLCRFIGLIKKWGESWETEGNVRPLLRDRFAQGWKRKVLDSTIMCGVTNLWSSQLTKDSSRPSHAKMENLRFEYMNSFGIYTELYYNGPQSRT